MSSIKTMAPSPSLSERVKNEIEALVIDIEGTTTPISFVTDVLFPYVKENLRNYLSENWDEEGVQCDIKDLQTQTEEDLAAGVKDVPMIQPINEKKSKESVIKSVVENVHWLMSQDRKITALKQLQGHMWRSAYENGSIKGDVYEDVPVALNSLAASGKKLYVYSSGSVEAQKLLFKYSNQGDLCPLFSGYFDTKVGNKKESSSYVKIAEEIGEKPNKILFLTDVIAEADAANEAKYDVCVLLRLGNKPLSKEDSQKYQTISSFDSLSHDDEVPTKCKKLENE